MAYKIDSIEICNFKFFEKPFSLKINGKNILLFGENGSGKSSIFWSFYTHYQAVTKEPKDARKYFLDANKESLRNRYTDAAISSGIKVTFKDEHGTLLVVEDSDTLLSVNSSSIKNMMLNTLTASDFFNYKVISSIFDFKNSQDNELFEVFQKEIFQSLILLTSLEVSGEIRGNDAYTWWQYIKSGYQNLPKNRKNYNDFNLHSPEYKAFKEVIDIFNNDLRFALTQLVISANQILRNEFLIPVELTVRYEPVKFNERLPDSSRARDRKVTPPRIILNAKMMQDDIKSQDIHHPSSFFNEAKLTCMALALRLAVLNGRPTEGPSFASSLFVDDLLISLDMSYRRKVIDVLLKSADKRQLLFFTHDRALFHMFKEELMTCKKSNDWIFYEMYSQNFNGHPVPELISTITPLEEAKMFLNEHRIAACANAIRRTCEMELRRLLPYNKQLKTDPEELSSTPLLNFNGLICVFEQMRREIGLPDIAHGLSTDRKLILNPFSHDDIETPFYRAELERLIACCSKLSEIKRKDIVTTKMVRNGIFQLMVNNAGYAAEASFEFYERMVCYIYEGKNYLTNPRVKILAGTVDKRFVGKEKRLNELYRNLYNSVSLNADTCPPILDVMYSPDGTLLVTHC